MVTMVAPKGRGVIDHQVRSQIRYWIRYEMHKRQISSQREAARKIGVSHAYLSRVLKDDGAAGTELLLRIHRTWHVSVDAMFDGLPPLLIERAGE